MTSYKTTFPFYMIIIEQFFDVGNLFYDLLYGLSQASIRTRGTVVISSTRDLINEAAFTPLSLPVFLFLFIDFSFGKKRLKSLLQTDR